MASYAISGDSKAPSRATLAHHSSWWLSHPKNIESTSHDPKISWIYRMDNTKFQLETVASRHLNPARRLKGSVGWDGDGWQRVAFWTGSWTTSSTQQRILQQGSSKERELNNCASEMMVFNTSHLARDTCTVGFLLIATTPVGCRVDGWA